MLSVGFESVWARLVFKDNNINGGWCRGGAGDLFGVGTFVLSAVSLVLHFYGFIVVVSICYLSDICEKIDNVNTLYLITS